MVNLAKSDESPKIPERVHIASVGYEIDRIVLPFRGTARRHTITGIIWKMLELYVWIVTTWRPRNTKWKNG